MGHSTGYGADFRDNKGCVRPLGLAFVGVFAVPTLKLSRLEKSSGNSHDLTDPLPTDGKRLGRTRKQTRRLREIKLPLLTLGVKESVANCTITVFKEAVDRFVEDPILGLSAAGMNTQTGAMRFTIGKGSDLKPEPTCYEVVKPSSCQALWEEIMTRGFHDL